MFGLPGGGLAVPAAGEINTFTNTYAVDFDGSNDYVTIGQPADLDLDFSAHEMTFAVWVKTSSLAAQQYVMSRARPYAPNIQAILGINTDGSVFGYFGGLASTASAASTITTGTWYLIAYTVKNVSGTYKGQLHVNGTHVTNGFDATCGSNVASGVDWLFGAARNSNNTDYVLNFTGVLDEAVFFDVALSNTEHAELYHGGSPMDPTGHSKSANLIHWYRMGDGDTYSTLQDGVGSANGTMTNMNSGDIVTDVP